MIESMRIESEVFRIKSSVLIKLMILCFGKSWIFASSILFFAGIITSFFDWRFLILALIVILFIIPMMIMFLYYDYGLRPYSYFNCSYHSLLFENDKIIVKVYIKEDPVELSNKVSQSAENLLNNDEWEARWEEKWVTKWEEKWEWHTAQDDSSDSKAIDSLTKESHNINKKFISDTHLEKDASNAKHQEGLTPYGIYPNLILKSTIIILRKDIKPYYIAGNNIIVPLATKPKGILIIPMDIWGEKEEFTKVIDVLTGKYS